MVTPPMLKKTRGIVFRNMKYSESSVICDIYTEELGLQSYIISGVRSKKAKTKASLLQVMTLLDLVVYNKKNSTLNRTKEVKSAVIFRSIPFNIIKSSIGLFMVELARKTIREAEANPPLFEFLFNSFVLLDEIEEGMANFHLFFIVRLTSYLGFEPAPRQEDSFDYFDLELGCFQSEKPNHFNYIEGSLTDLLAFLLVGSVEAICNHPVSRQVRNQFLEKMMVFYRLHIENLPPINSHEILQEVLKG